MPWTNMEARKEYQRQYARRADVRQKSVEQGRVYRRKNKDNVIYLEKQRKRSRRWRQENPLLSLLASARNRARRMGIPFDLTLADLLPAPTHCPVFGTKLVYSGRKNNPHSASIDRVDPNPKLGYIRNNVKIMSVRANQIKNNGTLAEHEAVLKWMRLNAAHGMVQAKPKGRFPPGS